MISSYPWLPAETLGEFRYCKTKLEPSKSAILFLASLNFLF